ncbi:MarR family transcriptional regulator [Leucobacter coleopterorum]|uniref:MarR family transcriptional regulator n=1 Tax=Leucobacter coleopterorum TaxID=2714933 RepID=UPI001FCB1A7A|nr:MarR family transcriptional regulator [Leucobacter coleopterorum]
MAQTTPSSERMAQEMQLLRAVRSFSDAQDRMHGGMKHGMKMNATDLAALRLIIIREEQQRSVSPHEIASHLRISTASTTKLLDRLTNSGHVRRAPTSPTAGRGSLSSLTPPAPISLSTLAHSSLRCAPPLKRSLTRNLTPQPELSAR